MFNLKTFTYEKRGMDLSALQGKIDAEVAAYLLGVSATNVGGITTVVGPEQLVVLVLWNDVI